MDFSGSFNELTPEIEVQKLVEENKKLEKEIKRLSFTSLKQRSDEDSMDGAATPKAKIVNITKPNQFNDSVDNEVSFFHTSFKPLPFDNAADTEDSLDADDQSFTPTTLPKQPPKASLPLKDGTHKQQTPQRSISPEWKKDNLPNLKSPKYQTTEHHPNSDISRKHQEKVNDVGYRLVGEIAFQLDRRILQHVFSHRKRLYGFTVRNVTQKIMEYTEDFQTGTVDLHKRKTLKEKRDNAFRFLQHNTGYNAKYHPIFSEMLVNKFGVLKISSKKSISEYDELQSADYIKSIILSVLNPEYTYDALILLDALVLFSDFDGKPLLLW